MPLMLTLVASIVDLGLEVVSSIQNRWVTIIDVTISGFHCNWGLTSKMWVTAVDVLYQQWISSWLFGNSGNRTCISNGNNSDNKNNNWPNTDTVNYV